MLSHKSYFGYTGDNPLIVDRPSGWSKWQRVLNNCQLISNEEQCELVLKAQAGCEVSLEKVVKSCLRLVMPVAKYYFKYNRLSSSLTVLDYVQYGNEGLVNAVYGFKNERECSFASYAMFYIKGYILNLAFSEMDFVKIPNKNKKDENGGRKPPVEIVRLDDALPEKQITDDTLTYEDLTQSDMLADASVRVNSFRQNFERILAELTSIEQAVIKLQYFHGINLNDIADSIGLSSERVRQIRDKAITKFRSPKRSAALKSLYEEWEFIGLNVNEREWEDLQGSLKMDMRYGHSKSELNETSSEQLERIARSMDAQIRLELRAERQKEKEREKEQRAAEAKERAREEDAERQMRLK